MNPLIKVFGGPSIVSVPPQAHECRLAPARLGDLANLKVSNNEVVVLIDAAFLQYPAPNHPELLNFLASGGKLIGSSSFGALRAVELERLGMVGIGRVFSA